MADTPPVGEGSPQPDQVTRGTTDSWDIVEGADNGLGHYLAQAPDPLPEAGLLLPGDQLEHGTGPREAIPCTPPHCGGVLLGVWLAPQKHPDDSADFRGVLGKCTRCFAKRVPKSWFVSRHGTVEGKDIPDLEVDTESSATSGSETDDSVDTQSEADAVPLPKVLPVESI